MGCLCAKSDQDNDEQKLKQQKKKIGQDDEEGKLKQQKKKMGQDDDEEGKLKQKKKQEQRKQDQLPGGLTKQDENLLTLKGRIALPLSYKSPEVVRAGTVIQAWWRGTLVRRTLQLAALNAWIIQSWWRRMLARRQEKKFQDDLEYREQRLWAVVMLQSWVRMWLVRQRYCRLRNAACIIQNYWRYQTSEKHDFFQGSYELRASQLKLELDIYLGPQICRITDCLPFPIKD